MYQTHTHDFFFVVFICWGGAYQWFIYPPTPSTIMQSILNRTKLSFLATIDGERYIEPGNGDETHTEKKQSIKQMQKIFTWFPNIIVGFNGL